MNAGIIASRYAKAFLEYVQENETGKDVYSQVCTLVACMHGVPVLREYLMNTSDISLQRKIQLMSSALDAPVNPSLERFLSMVTDSHRIEFFPRMLLSFIEQYRRANDIIVGRLTTAVQVEGLRERLENIFHDRTGAEVHLEAKVVPEIMGGFIFELDGSLVDASAKGQLQRIRRKLVEKNNRIV